MLLGLAKILFSKKKSSELFFLYTTGDQDSFSGKAPLGLGDYVDRNSYTKVGSDNWIQVSMSDQGFSLGIKSDGTLWGWGNGSYGSLGFGTVSYPDAYPTTPTQVGSDTDWLLVSCGNDHSLAMKQDGTIYSAGTNSLGQLGRSTATVSNDLFGQIGSSSWSKISAAYDYSMAIRTDGTLWGWGRNSAGQLGLGNTTFSYSSPQQVGSGTNWEKISCGYDHALAIKTDGTLWTWGNNNFGELGTGNTTNYTSPQQVGSDTDWLTVSACFSHTIALKTDGTLWTCGRNANGELALGDSTQRNSLTQVGSDTDWAIINEDSYYSFSTKLTKTDGTHYVCGSNTYGQLGLGNNTDYNTLQQVGSDSDWGISVDVLFSSAALKKT